MQLYGFGALDFAVKQNKGQTKPRLELRQLFKPIGKVYHYLISVFLNSLFHLTNLLGRISIVPQSINTSSRFNKKALVGYPLLVVITLLWLVPLLWMFSTSIKPEQQVRQIPIEWVSPDTTFDNYTRVWEAYPLLEWGLNSFNVALLTTIVALVLYVLAAYPLAFYRFRGRGFLFLGILATMLIPVEATMIPLFIVLAKLRVVDSYMSLIMPVAANAFGLYLLVQFSNQYHPRCLISARIDGATELQILLRIVVPLSGPALTTVAILTFMTSWNNFVCLSSSPTVTQLEPCRSASDGHGKHHRQSDVRAIRHGNGGLCFGYTAANVDLYFFAAILCAWHFDEWAEGLIARTMFKCELRANRCQCVDENVAAAMIDQLAEKVVDIKRVSHVLPEGTLDPDVLAHAHENGYALLTHDEQISRHIATRRKEGTGQGGVFIAGHHLQGRRRIGAAVMTRWKRRSPGPSTKRIW